VSCHILGHMCCHVDERIGLIPAASTHCRAKTKALGVTGARELAVSVVDKATARCPPLCAAALCGV
jgi:hypothetical protein